MSFGKQRLLAAALDKVTVSLHHNFSEMKLFSEIVGIPFAAGIDDIPLPNPSKMEVALVTNLDCKSECHSLIIGW